MNNSKANERMYQTRVNNQGLTMKIIKYIEANEIYVQFDDGEIVKTAWREFDKGGVNNPNCKDKGQGYKKDFRIGEIKLNNQGCKMEIVQYNNANSVFVKFNDNTNQVVETTYQSFKNGKTKNPYIPSVYNVGITGVDAPCMDGKKKIKEYRCWVQMIERCYSNNEYTRKKDSTYNNCYVSDEFLYYPNFYNWITHQGNYEAWKYTDNFALDKDILCKGNKIYAADKCCLVPNRINNLIQKNKSRRGEYLIGVYKNDHNQYVAQCWNGIIGKNIILGKFNDEYEAFLAYKKYKEDLIKQSAELEYKNGVITKECRDALLKYKIEISD